MIISERIFKILKDKNMSQNAFAKQVGLASSTISDWKTKKTNPSADKIMDICVVLEVTPEQLLTGKGIDEDYVEHKPKKVKEVLELSKTDIRIIEDIHAMKEVQRKRLLKYMEALKQIEALEDFKY
ncbi:MAG: helix-turn-helix transcriptional regulator [Lachnospiraceae bacterium]|nr:helix-turn-helix transcriptional regulator [Lachnospiraceae bacterium]